MAFRRVALLSEIPTDTGLGITLEGQKIGLYRLGDRLYAMEDVCPHAGTLLHPGTLIGTLVVCPGHGWEFDLRAALHSLDESRDSPRSCALRARRLDREKRVGTPGTGH
jgi:nitrite reductase/ring-hydroxylating ferredoxin subunit